MWVARAMDDVLDGRTYLSDADPSIQSCLRLTIYHKACQILELETKEQRRAEIGNSPELIRPFLEKEILRVWELRRNTK